jgi:hypothetical protein
MKKLLRKIHFYYWLLIDFLWIFIKKNEGNNVVHSDFSIGIVTYVDRYDKFFKKLLRNIVVLFPNTEVIVAVNGYFDSEIQTKYLGEVTCYGGQFKNVRLITFNMPQSLSKLWNQLIIKSTNEKIFIFNDDIKISTLFKYFLLNSGILSEKFALINYSYSHFLISKSLIKLNGWFDERFPAVGNEDEDYECRLVFNNVKVKSFRIFGIKNVVYLTKKFSYGKNVESINDKYVKSNKLFFDRKWEVSVESKEGFKYVRIIGKFVKLRDGMETPNFYPTL